MSVDDVRALGLSVIDAYRSRGSLAFAYAQGSLVEGLAAVADLDLVLVWTDRPPAADRRVPDHLADAEPPAQSFDQPGFNLDRFYVDGQEIDAKHVPLDEVDAWWTKVCAGHGTSGYPMPAIALHGLTTGLMLFDTGGDGAARAERFSAVPVAFTEAVTHRLTTSSPALLDELEHSAARGDHLLFHDQLVQLVRIGFIAWYAKQGRWWPHEKRLSLRLRRLGRADLAQLEEEVWVGALDDRLKAARRLNEALTE